MPCDLRIAGHSRADRPNGVPKEILGSHLRLYSVRFVACIVHSRRLFLLCISSIRAIDPKSDSWLRAGPLFK